eukprot:15071949-Alexandrium_andersonii.AAC.1
MGSAPRPPVPSPPRGNTQEPGHPPWAQPPRTARRSASIERRATPGGRGSRKGGGGTLDETGREARPRE